jgi:hypothetical protein
MQSKYRFGFALVTMLCGLLLVPFVALPKESFRWQAFVGAYGSEVGVGVNFEDGAPGSYFLISGFGFEPGANLTLRANGYVFGTAEADANGEFRLLISTRIAGVGRYVISVEVNAEEGAPSGQTGVVASTSFVLAADAPLRARPAGTESLTPAVLPNRPAGAGEPQLWLPLVER